MEKQDIIDFLETFVKKQKSEVNFGTYRPTTRSSLLKEGLGTRANSVWKQSQFVVAYMDGKADGTLEQCLDGWKELTRCVFDQYLILEEPKNEWTVYDKFGHSKGNIEYLKEVSQNPSDYVYNNSNELGIVHTSTSLVNSKYRPYITAIKSKPFLLLAGISGTGKSRIVRELARACWDVGSSEYKAHKPKNYEMVQVKPNWHDSSELIGYVSRINGEQYVVGPFLRFMVKAILDPDTPYFLCLDEMNLAPVEQYFAEFLSVIESRKNENGKVVTDPIVDYEPTEAYKSLIDQLFDDDEIRAEYLKEKDGKRLSIPQNLIVVGTVNMDETTFSFSRKVLDRAMTIEMNDVDLAGGLTDRHEDIGKLEYDDLVGSNVEGVDVYKDYQAVCDQAIEYLQKLNDVLEGTPFKVAYRTRNEFLLYVVNNLPYRKDEAGNDLTEEEVVARALDEITSMKVLSRIEGDDQKVNKELLERLKKVVVDMLLENIQSQSVSLSKLEEMETRCESGFTSFWS